MDLVPAVPTAQNDILDLGQIRIIDQSYEATRERDNFYKTESAL